MFFFVRLATNPNLPEVVLKGLPFEPDACQPAKQHLLLESVAHFGAASARLAGAEIQGGRSSGAVGPDLQHAPHLKLRALGFFFLFFVFFLGGGRGSAAPGLGEFV